MPGACEEAKAVDDRANGLERLISLKGMLAVSDSAVLRIYFGEYKEFTRWQKNKRQQFSLIDKFARTSDMYLVTSVFDAFVKHFADSKRARQPVISCPP